MKTDKLQFTGYFETTGGPICICSVEKLKDWTGASTDDGLYWQAIDKIGTSIVELFQKQFYLFNSETGNFSLFRSENSLVIAEIVSMEPSFAMPWEGISFEIKDWQLPMSNLTGMLSIFDSSLSLTLDTKEECFRAVNGSSVWNAAFINGNYSICKEVYFSSKKAVFSGALLTNF